MTERSHKKTTPPADGLVLMCLLSGAILLLSVLTGAALSTAIPVWLGSLAILWIYLRRRAAANDGADTAITQDDLDAVRSQMVTDLIDSLPRPAAMLNALGEVLAANAAAQEMLSPNMVGRPLTAYLRSSDLFPRLERAFAGEAVPPISIHILAPAERYIDVAFSTPMKLKPTDRGADVALAIFADRTQATVEREQRADFLANASHELKTPIASIKGYIETLRGHAKDDPKAREKFLVIMQDQAERMERLVIDLLSLRRIESREHIAPTQSADLCEALGGAFDAIRPLAEAHGVTLHLSKDVTEATIFGKTDECVQLFINLIENAVKLSPEGSQVDVTLTHLPQWQGTAFPNSREQAATRRIINLVPSEKPAWRVTISDAGPGFSRDHLPRIGERFYRVAGDLPAQEKGTGLGLAIVKHIARRHRAGLFIQTATAASGAPNPGTDFSVVFTATDQIA